MSGKAILWGIVVSVCLVTAAAAAQPPLVVDDFETYWHHPPPPWQDISPGPSTAGTTLLTSGVPQGTAAMQIDFHTAGGWQNPTDMTDFSVWDQAAVEVTFDTPLDFAQYGSGWELHMDIRPYDFEDLDFFLIQFMQGGQAAQAWMPSATWMETTGPWWWPSEDFAVIIGEYTPPGPPKPQFWPPDDPPWAPEGIWTEVVFNPQCIVWYSWAGWATGIDELDAIDAISIWAFGGSDPIGDYKLDLTGGTIWPPGPMDTRLDVDYIVIVPEPATIALLGLGGLALLNRRKIQT